MPSPDGRGSGRAVQAGSPPTRPGRQTDETAMVPSGASDRAIVPWSSGARTPIVVSVRSSPVPSLRLRRARLVPTPSIGWLRPPLPGTDLPAPESPARPAAIPSIAGSALAVAMAYLPGRTVATVDLAVWWVSVPLLVLEYHAALGLTLFTFSLWDVDRRPDVEPVHRTTQKIALLFPTYN